MLPSSLSFRKIYFVVSQEEIPSMKATNFIGVYDEEIYAKSDWFQILTGLIRVTINFQNKT